MLSCSFHSKVLVTTLRLLALAGMAASSAKAVDPDKNITQLAHQSWGPSEGIDSVYAINQTADGCIWAVAANGVFKFDGQNFVAAPPWPDQPGLPGRAIDAVTTKEGSIWVGATVPAGTAFHIRPKNVAAFGTNDGIVAGSFASFAVGQSQNELWLGTKAGLFRFDGRHWEKIGGDRGLPDGIIAAAHVDQSGSLWVSVDDWRKNPTGTIACLRPGETRFRLAGMQTPVATCLTEGPDGRMWMAQNSGVVRPFSFDDNGLRLLPPGIQAQCVRIFFDHHGVLWIPTLGEGLRRIRDVGALGTNGLAVTDEGVDKFTEQDGLSSDIVYSVFEDREGNIWTGTAAGMDCFSETKFTALSNREGLPFDQNLLVQATPDGALWAGGTHHGFEELPKGGAKFIDHGWAGLNSPANTAADTVFCLCTNEGGTLFLGTSAGIGVVKNGACALLKLPQPLNEVTAITADKGGALWLCDRNKGVQRWINGALEKVFDTSVSKGAYICAAATDHSGKVWLGWARGGVSVWDNGQARSYNAADGLLPGRPQVIYCDTQGDIWVAGAGGASHFDGARFKTFHRQNGLPLDEVAAFLQDDDKAFWIGGMGGVFRVPADAMRDALHSPNAMLSGRLFDLTDGLRGFVRQRVLGGPTLGSPCATKTTDGKLWFSTSRGLAVIDPRAIPQNKNPPPVSIQRIVAGEKSYPPENGLVLPKGDRDCEIDYAALSFENPAKIRYRYRLEGYDTEWIEARGRRQAFYSHLRPRNYRFHVIACNADGFWNDIGESFDFAIAPRFYQTSWFMALAAVGIVFGALGLHRLRLARSTARVKLQMQAQLEERQRIAVDLHDTLLQGLTGIGLKLHVIARNSDRFSPGVGKQLQSILEESDRCLDEARRSVWRLRPSSLEKTDDFPSALSHSARQRLGQDILPRFSITGEPRPLGALVENHLLRIGEEAVSNAARHGKPTQVKILLEYLPRELRLTVADDGRGFDPASISTQTGHFGLIGMKLRVKNLKGDFDMETAPGQGTKIMVTIPLP